MYIAGIRPYYLNPRKLWLSSYQQSMLHAYCVTYSISNSVPLKFWRRSWLMEKWQTNISLLLSLIQTINQIFLQGHNSSKFSYALSSRNFLFNIRSRLVLRKLRLYSQQVKNSNRFWLTLRTTKFKDARYKNTNTLFLKWRETSAQDYFYVLYKAYYLKGEYRPAFLIVRQTLTNLYVTLTDLHGNTLYAITAGQLGIRKRWSRLWPATFGTLLDSVLSFIRKYKISRRFIFMLQSTRKFKSYLYLLRKRMRKARCVVDKFIYIMPSIHGNPLRKRRLKRL